MPTHTLADAVRAGNEFLQIKPANEKGTTSVRQIEDGEVEEEVLSPTERTLTTLMKTMQQLVEKVEHLQTRPTGAAPKRDLNKEQMCWECGKGGGISDGIALVKRSLYQIKRPRETDKARNSSTPSCLQSGI